MPKTEWLREWESGSEDAKAQVRAAFVSLLRERVGKMPTVAWKVVRKVANKVAEEAVEKLNWRATVRDLRELGVKHGPRFLVYAIAIEVFEDVVLPAFCAAIGRPELAPLALAFHMEPVAYPAYFAVAKLVKRLKESSNAQKAQMYVMHTSASSADGGTRKPLAPVQTAEADSRAQRGARRQAAKGF